MESVTYNVDRETMELLFLAYEREWKQLHAHSNCKPPQRMAAGLINHALAHYIGTYVLLT